MKSPVKRKAKKRSVRSIECALCRRYLFVTGALGNARACGYEDCDMYLVALPEAAAIALGHRSDSGRDAGMSRPR